MAKDQIEFQPSLGSNTNGASESASGVRELTAREVNKQIREEARQEKRKSKVAARGVGHGLEVLGRCKRRHPNDPKGQLAMFFSEFVIKASIGRSRPVSARTNTAYANTLMSCIDDLRTQNAAIRNISELGKAHVLILTRYWIAAGQSAGTVQNKISVLRCFLTWCGKDKAVPRGEDLREWLAKNGIEAPQWRQTVATKDQTWGGNGISVKDVVRRITELCEWTAIELEMCEAFGLRVRESISIIPRASDYGDMLQVNYGTKGGLARSVPFDDDPITSAAQRDVLERAKVMASRHPKGLLARPGHSLAQNVKHFYRVLEKAGVTRKQLGVTAHGLRHEYAERQYEQISGYETPVSGGMPIEVTEEVQKADLLARRKVSRSLGHFRDDVTKAYVGSIPMMSRERKKRISDWVNLTEGSERFQAVLKNHGVTGAWLGGRFATGLEVTAGEPIRLYVRGAQPMGTEILAKLGLELESAAARGFDVSEISEHIMQRNCLEIFVREPKGGV